MAKPFNVRMEDDLRAAIDERVAAGEATNASQWAREALAGVIELGGLDTLRSATEMVGRTGTGPQPHPARALQLQGREQPGTLGRSVVATDGPRAGVTRQPDAEPRRQFGLSQRS